ncbi:MAG TPA: hypothetical protein VJM12_13175 [Pyrinomonadaceae bacterium]|nr:hypothetical protein [Pyrinomonadaceae bacterium]
MGALAVLIGLGLSVWLYVHPPHPTLPTVVYLLLAIIGGILWLSETSDLFWSSVAFALTLPWSALFLFVVMSFDVQPPPWLVLPGLAVNALLLYVAARWRARQWLLARVARDNKSLQTAS